MSADDCIDFETALAACRELVDMELLSVDQSRVVEFLGSDYINEGLSVDLIRAIYDDTHTTDLPTEDLSTEDSSDEETDEYVLGRRLAEEGEDYGSDSSAPNDAHALVQPRDREHVDAPSETHPDSKAAANKSVMDIAASIFDEEFPEPPTEAAERITGSFPEMSEFTESISPLGEGFYGLTFRTALKGVPVVLKVSKEKDAAASAGDYHEWSINERLKHHPNVIKIFGLCPAFHLSAFPKLGTTALILPHQGNGGLDSFVRDHCDRKNEQQMASIAFGMIQGLRSLHEQRAIHRDIALRNYLVDGDGRVIICDFGLTKFLPLGKTHFVRQDHEKLPWRALAPESIREKLFSKESDIWMYGAALFHLLTNKKLWSGMDVEELKRTFKQETLQLMPQDAFNAIPEKLAEIIRSCCQLRPNKRPSAMEICRRLAEMQMIDLADKPMRDSSNSGISAPAAPVATGTGSAISPIAVSKDDTGASEDHSGDETSDHEDEEEDEPYYEETDPEEDLTDASDSDAEQPRANDPRAFSGGDDVRHHDSDRQRRSSISTQRNVLATSVLDIATLIYTDKFYHDEDQVPIIPHLRLFTGIKPYTAGYPYLRYQARYTGADDRVLSCILKVPRPGNPPGTGIEAAFQEWNLSQKLAPNRSVSRTLAVCTQFKHPDYENRELGEDTPANVSLFAENGPLGNFINVDSRDWHALDEWEAANVAFGMIQGIRSLHDQGVIYRDIKLENFAVDADGRIVLINLSTAKVIGDEKASQDMEQTSAFNWRLLAPESFLQGFYTKESDIWTYGQTLVRIFTGLMPWPQFRGPNQLRQALENETLELPDLSSFPAIVVSIIRDCFKYKPSERPSAYEIAERLARWHYKKRKERMGANESEKQDLTSPNDAHSDA